MSHDKSVKLHNLKLLQQRLSLEPTVAENEDDDARETASAQARASGFPMAPASGFLAG